MELLTDTIHKHAITKPKHLALAWINQKGEVSKKATYKELSTWINQMSSHLSHTTSLQSGDKAALLYPTGFDFILVFLACMQMGVISVPLKYPNHPQKFLKLLPILNECEPNYLLSTRPLEVGTLSKVPWVKTTIMGNNETFRKANSLPDIAFLQYTSGSTGNPKGVMVAHDNLLHNLKLMYTYLMHNNQNVIIVSWLPHYHDMGLIGSYLTTLYYGCTGYYMAPTTFMVNPNLFLQVISDVKATSIQCPNTAYEYMCANWDGRVLDISALKTAINAAEPVHPATLEKFYQTFKKSGLNKTALLPTYGLAEATLFVSAANIPTHASYQNPVPYGRFPEIDIRIVEPTLLTELNENQEGEIWLHSLCNARGYYRKKELTEATFKAKISGCDKEYLRTGDLGFMRGRELYITGRIKELIIINGANIYPQDIEYTVLQFNGIQPHGCVAFAIEENLATQVVIVAEVIESDHLPNINVLYQYILQYHDIPLFDLILCPRYTLPKTTSGKLKRLECKEAFINKNLSILKRWRVHRPYDLLDDVDTDHSKTFSELGFDSLSIAHLYHQLSQRVAPKYKKDLLITRLYAMQKHEYLKIVNAKSCRDQEMIILSWLNRAKKNTENCNKQIRNDAHLKWPKTLNLKSQCRKAEIKNILLTGSTGFLGAYLLYELLKKTECHLYLLVRAKDEASGLSRVIHNLRTYHLLDALQLIPINHRITIVCGDLAQINLGLEDNTWMQLAEHIDCIYHNGAITHYLSSYQDLRSTNVLGTQTIIQLAMTTRLKYIHYISTTLIFGFTPVKYLVEDQRNSRFKHVHFGYAESKWVAEQLIWHADRFSVPIQIYRPAMVTASSQGQYTKEDIVARSLTYFLNHGVALNIPNQISFMPVDKVAHDIVLISLCQDPKHKVYHIASSYANLPMICRYLTETYQFQFQYLSLADFNQHLLNFASVKDLIYPLVSFFNAHYHRIDKMRHKRYGRKNYLDALTVVNSPAKSFTLEETIDFMMQFFYKTKLIG